MARTKGNRKRARAEAGDDFRDMYTGWRPPAGGDACLEAHSLEAHSLEPEGFWRAHIAPRRPAVIRAPLPGLEAVRCWTDDGLVSAAVRGFERPLAERPPGTNCSLRTVLTKHCLTCVRAAAAAFTYVHVVSDGLCTKHCAQFTATRAGQRGRERGAAGRPGGGLRPRRQGPHAVRRLCAARRRRRRAPLPHRAAGAALLSLLFGWRCVAWPPACALLNSCPQGARGCPRPQRAGPRVGHVTLPYTLCCRRRPWAPTATPRRWPARWRSCALRGRCRCSRRSRATWCRSSSTCGWAPRPRVRGLNCPGPSPCSMGLPHLLCLPSAHFLQPAAPGLRCHALAEQAGPMGAD